MLCALCLGFNNSIIRGGNHADFLQFFEDNRVLCNRNLEKSLRTDKKAAYEFEELLRAPMGQKRLHTS